MDFSDSLLIFWSAKLYLLTVKYKKSTKKLKKIVWKFDFLIEKLTKPWWNFFENVEKMPRNRISRLLREKQAAPLNSWWNFTSKCIFDFWNCAYLAVFYRPRTVKSQIIQISKFQKISIFSKKYVLVKAETHDFWSKNPLLETWNFCRKSRSLRKFENLPNYFCIKKFQKWY